MTFLLDTNVISEVRKRRTDAGVAAWWDRVPASRLYLSVLTIGELRRGVERVSARGDTVHAASLAEWLTKLTSQFADRLLPVDVGVAGAWARLAHKRPTPVVDALLAATAIRHDLTLVTRNTRDVEDTGVKILDPFTGRA